MTNEELINILRTGSRALIYSLRAEIADRLEYLGERVDIMSEPKSPDPKAPQEPGQQMRLI